MKPIIRDAYAIAVRSLRKCYEASGIVAGRHHFHELWAWDSFYASYGSLRLNDLTVVRANLVTYLRHVSAAGQVPFHFGGNLDILLRFLGIPRQHIRLTPSYTLSPLYYLFRPDAGSHDKAPLTANSLFIIAADAYLRKCHDRLFRERFLSKSAEIIRWYDNRLRERLIYEYPHQGWMDSLRRTGWSFYTNLCYWKALSSLAAHWQRRNRTQAAAYRRMARGVSDRIRQVFWTGTYFTDFVDSATTTQRFATDSNMLAIMWGFTDARERTLIITAYQRLRFHQLFPGALVSPPYPKALTPKRFTVLGLRDYHNHPTHWLWVGCITAIALMRVNRTLAEQTILAIAEAIVRYDDVYEIYTPAGAPFRSFGYRSEYPFAWSAGLFIEACHVIEKQM